MVVEDLGETERELELAIIETRVSPGALVDMSVPEVRMFLLRAMEASRHDEWGAPNIALMALSSLERIQPRLDATTTRDLRYVVTPIVTDAMAWLISGGILGPAARKSGSTGEWSITSAGRTALERGSASHAEASRRLHAELHPTLVDARLNFERGQLELSTLAAMRAVEIELREAAGLGADSYGIGLARKALGPAGPFTITADTPAEQEGFANLFAGAIGALKNPSSHRAVEYDDPAEAADIIHFADLLLRIIDREKERRLLTSS